MEYKLCVVLILQRLDILMFEDNVACKATFIDKLLHQNEIRIKWTLRTVFIFILV